MDEIINVLVSTLQQVLIIVLTGLGAVGIAWVKEKFGTEKMKKLGEILGIHKEVIREGILYAQQAFEGSDCEVRLEEAKKFILARLNEIGVKISEETLDKLVESVLIETKDSWVGEWNKQLEKDKVEQVTIETE